jgi:hypothetical protein
MRIQRSIHRAATTTLAVALVALCVIQARADVTSQLPAESLVVMKVNNLAGLSQKLGKLSQDLGLAQMKPEMGDPLGSLKKSMNIQKGLNESGDLGFAFIDPSTVKGAAKPAAAKPAAAADGADADDKKEPPLVMLWPVTDYKAFVSNFGEAQDAGSGVTQIKVPDNDEPQYVAQWGNYAAISPSKAVVSMKPMTGGLKVSGKGAEAMQKNDMTVWTNIPALRTKYQSALSQNRDKWLKQVDTAVGKDPETAKFVPVAKAALNQALEVANSTLRDAQSATWGVNFGENGITSTMMADFTPGSEVGGYVQGFKASNDPLLRGIPADKYLMFGGMQSNPATMTKLFDQIAGPILAQINTLPPEQANALKQYADSMKKSLGAIQSQTGGMLAPSGQLGQEPIIQFVAVVRGDAKTIRQSQIDIAKNQQQLQNVFQRVAENAAHPQGEAGDNANAGDANAPKPAGGAAAATPELMKVTVEPNAKTVDGVQFDIITTALNPEAQNDPKAMQAQMAMNWMYGPNGARVMVGSLDDKNVLVASGVPDEVLSKVIAAAKKSDDPLDANAAVKSVSDQLPKNRIAVMYVPLDQVVSTIANYAGAFGMQVPIQLPPDLPPIGTAISTDGATLRADSYVPTELVKALTAAAIQVQMQMQGGRQPGGPGGL